MSQKHKYALIALHERISLIEEQVSKTYTNQAECKAMVDEGTRDVEFYKEYVLKYELLRDSLINEIEEINFLASDTLKNFKADKDEERNRGRYYTLRDARVVILDGQYAMKIATFKSWNGTNCIIRLEGNTYDTGLSIKRRIAILRSRR